MRKSNSKFMRTMAAAFPHTIPILPAFLILGLAYGILMDSKGYGVIWSVLMSAFAFCGSMQYAAITLLTTVFDPLQTFLLSLMVNARHLFYGISLLGKYKGMGKIKPVLIYLMCDENFSLSYSVEPPEDVEPKYFYLAMSLLDYFYWVFSTFLGGIAGACLSFNTKGLDFALTALFVVLFLEQLKSRQSAYSGIIGLLASVAALAVFGADNLVIPAMVIILAVMIFGRKLLCR